MMLAIVHVLGLGKLIKVPRLYSTTGRYVTIATPGLFEDILISL